MESLVRRVDRPPLLSAFRKLHDYGRRFQQRETLIRQIPKFTITDSDIEQLFSAERKTTVPPIIVAPPTTTVIPNDDHEEPDEKDKKLSAKELRRQKVVEKVKIERDEEETREEERMKTEVETDL